MHAVHGACRASMRAQGSARYHVATMWPSAQCARDLRCMQRGEWALIVRALCFAELAGCCGVVRRVSPQSVQTLCTVAHPHETNVKEYEDHSAKP